MGDFKYKYIIRFINAIYWIYLWLKCIFFYGLNTHIGYVLLKKGIVIMKIGVTEISPRAVQQHAEKSFKDGYYCCEALMSTIREDFKIDVPEEVIAMASGMAVGVGKSGCACGAMNGGVLALGMLFGRTEQNGPTNPDSIKCMQLTHELHDWFRDNNGKHAICCRILTREFNMGQGEHKEQCIYFTGLCAWKVATIICRELGIKNLDEIDEPCARRTIAEIA